MLVNSASQNQHTYRASPSIATQAANATRRTQATQAKSSTNGATSAAPSTSSSFSNGKFAGAAQLTSPETLASLFQLNDDGSVVRGDNGVPVVKQGLTSLSTADRLAVGLAMGPRETWSAADRASMAEFDKITDDDKAMFRQVTGYNIASAGTMVMIVDDQGNPPIGDDAKAAGELFNRLQYARSSGQQVDADWFHGVSKDIADWRGPTFPADWDQKVDAWFDDVTKARREAKAAEAGMTSSSAAEMQSAASRPVEHSKMQAATQAYGEAAKLAGPAES